MDAVAVPVELEQLLTLALGTVAVTQALKYLAARVDTVVEGKGSILISALVAGLLTALSVSTGWVSLPSVVCTYSEPVACLSQIVAVAGAVLALANVLYVFVYSRVFGSTEEAGA